jgi:hypothetical protein
MNFTQIKIHRTSQHSDQPEELEIIGSDKNDKTYTFTLTGKNRCLLFGSRFQVGACVNIETYDIGGLNHIKRMEKAIDTIEEND